MKPIIWKEIRERKFSLIAYSVATVGLIWMYVSLFPSLQSQAQNYNKILESMPKGFMEAFGVSGNWMSNLESFLSTEMFSMMWPLLAIFLVVSRAGGALAGEIDKTTIGTLLAQPISRTRLFIAKYSSGIIALAVYIACSILLTIPLAKIYSIAVMPKNYFTLSLLCLLFGGAIFSFAIFISAISSERSRVYGIIGGILVLMYATNIISGLKPSLRWIHNFSIFHFFNAPGALIHNHLDWFACLVLITSIVVFSLLGLAFFNKRDIAI